MRMQRVFSEKIKQLNQYIKRNNIKYYDSSDLSEMIKRQQNFASKNPSSKLSPLRRGDSNEKED